MSRLDTLYVCAAFCSRAVVIALLSTLFAAPAAPQNPDFAGITKTDAFINEVFSTKDTARFEIAAEAYLDLLAARAATDSERTVLERHVQLSTHVMPRAERPADSDPAAGEQIALWWRRQDPFPATKRNERLEEHLARWAFAMDSFEDPMDPRGFDDRGEIYVRLGPPGTQLSVKLDKIVSAFDFRYSVSVPDLPDNVTWVYRHIHYEAYYFFVRDSRRDGYRLSRPSEMIPPRLRDGLDSRTDRGRQKSAVLLQVMEEVYAPLALAHPIFGSTYDAIAGFRGLPPPSATRPDLFARSTLAAASNVETESAGRRGDVVPASFSNTLGMTEILPIESRTVRFLDPDGTTRTEILWGIDTSELEPSRRLERTLSDGGFMPSDQYLLATSVVRQTPDYQQREVQTTHYLLKPTEDEHLRVQSVSVGGDTGLYHVAVQWTQHWTEMLGDGTLGEGALLKIATGRFDSLHALNGQGNRLEMSDLKPIGPARDTPFPFTRLSRSAPPDLMFELYNLNFGPNDQTSYSVEYEVSRGTARRTTTRARTSNSGSTRQSSERITLDLSDWQEGGEISIVVRVTDDVTEEQVSRSISFIVEPR